MSDNYGLNIRTNTGRFLCDGSNPLFTVVGSFPTEVVPGTEGTPVGGYHSVWATSSLIKAEYSPTLLLPCNTGYTAPYCVGEGFAAFITSAPNGAPVQVCSPSGYAPPSTGMYGLEAFDSNGDRIFSSTLKQVVIRDIVQIPVSELDSAIIGNRVVSRSHISLPNPLYIIDGFQCLYIQTERVSYYNVYQSYAIYAKAGIVNTSPSSFNAKFVYLGTCSSQGSISQNGWLCYDQAISVISTFGGMSDIYAGALYRYSPTANLTVLVCETK